MNPVQKLEADKARHVYAVDKAVDKTTLLKTKLQETEILTQDAEKDVFGRLHGAWVHGALAPDHVPGHAPAQQPLCSMPGSCAPTSKACAPGHVRAPTLHFTVLVPWSLPSACVHGVQSAAWWLTRGYLPPSPRQPQLQQAARIAKRDSKRQQQQALKQGLQQAPNPWAHPRAQCWSKCGRVRTRCVQHYTALQQGVPVVVCTHVPGTCSSCVGPHVYIKHGSCQGVMHVSHWRACLRGTGVRKQSVCMLCVCVTSFVHSSHHTTMRACTSHAGGARC